MAQNEVENALTSSHVIDMFSFLIKNGFTEDLLEKFAYLNLGKYDVDLKREFTISNSFKTEPEKKVFNGIVLKAKGFSKLCNATAISLIYRTVENISKETLCDATNDGLAFINNINSITNILNQKGNGSCEGYSVYISDNPQLVLKVLEYAHGRINLNSEEVTTIEKELDKDFNKDRLYILLCEYSYSLSKSGYILPYPLYLKTVDLTN